MGLVNVSGGSGSAILNLSSTMSTDFNTGALAKLLSDKRFVVAGSCANRYTQFGASGQACSVAQAEFVKSKGGCIQWLSKDIRGIGQLPTSTCAGSVATLFRSALTNLAVNNGEDTAVHLSMNLSSVAPRPVSSCTTGWSLKELLDMAFLAGSSGKVSVVDISAANMEASEVKPGKLVSSIFYHFMLGLASRNISDDPSVR